MKKSISFLLSFVILLSVISLGGVAYANDKVTVNINGTYGQTEARSMLKMINDFRKSSDAWFWDENNEKYICSGLQDFTYDYELEEAAMQRAAEISAKFSHTRPNGGSCFDINENIYAENIAAGSSTAEGAFYQWREDNDDFSGQGHRRSMLSAGYTAIGIAYFECDGWGYWVQEFGFSNTGKPETSAKDEKASVPIEILTSDISYKGVAYVEESYTVKAGSKIAVPDTVPAIVLNGCWPDGRFIEVEGKATYKAKDSSVIKIESDEIVGLKVGKTILTVSYDTVFGTLSRDFTITVKAPTIKATTVFLKAIKKGFKASIKSVSGVTGYEIKYSRNKSFKNSKTIRTSKPSKTVKKLKKKKTYYVKVRSYKSINGVKYYSKWSKVKKVKTK